jgi:hypothetical protein
MAWQRSRLAELSIDAGLSESEQFFLQSVIRLADTSGVLTDNALARPYSGIYGTVGKLFDYCL